MSCFIWSLNTGLTVVACFDSKYNLVEAGKQSRPTSAKLSRPTSGKLSRPSSGKISRPQSGRLSRPASGKQSRPSSARATPELKESEQKTETGSLKIDDKIESQTNEKTDAQSKVVEPKAVETKLPEHSPVNEEDKVDKNEPKQETNTEHTKVKSGRQKGIKMKKPPSQRQRPGAKNVNSTKTDKPPVIGGYIPQQEAKKTPESVQGNEVQLDNKDVAVPDVTIEAELGKIEEEALIEGSTEEQLETSGLATGADKGI